MKKILLIFLISNVFIDKTFAEDKSHYHGIPKNYSTNEIKHKKNITSNKLDIFLNKNQDLKKAFIGIKIKNVSTGKDIYSYNDKKLFIPASNTKIFTTLLALEKLGKDFRYKTGFSTDEYKEKENKTFAVNNLYLNLSGDPTLKNSHIKELINDLKDKKISEIKGSIILDTSIFDKTVYGPGWMWDDLNDCDDSPISPIYLDDNCLKIQLFNKNKETKVETKNLVNINIDELEINDNLEENIEIKNISENNDIYIKGILGKNKSAEIEQSILKPESYFISILKKELKNTFNFNGDILVSDQHNSNTITLAEHTSETLSEILKKFNKESHNLTGELLLKTIALKEKGKGSTKLGSEILKDYLEKVFKDNDFKFVDGSGLSRYNLVSPELISNILSYIYNNNEYKEVIFKAFPMGGVEGTLKNRLKNIKDYKVIAKSGSMTGVNCLSGYLVSDKKDVLSFSILINSSNASGKVLRDIQDKILELVIQES